MIDPPEEVAKWLEENGCPTPKEWHETKDRLENREAEITNLHRSIAKQTTAQGEYIQKTNARIVELEKEIIGWQEVHALWSEGVTKIADEMIMSMKDRR